MRRITLSDQELRGLTEGGVDLSASQSLFEPSDFADASRASHRLFGAAVTRLARQLGGKIEPMPPEIGLTAAEAMLLAARRHPEWAWVLEFTGQFRATALLALTGQPERSEAVGRASPSAGLSLPVLAHALPLSLPKGQGEQDAGQPPAFPLSAEAIAVCLDDMAGDVEVAFRREFKVNVAVSVRLFDAGPGELPVSAPSGGFVAVGFDLELDASAPAGLSLFADAAFVRELAGLIRPSRADVPPVSPHSEARPPDASPAPMVLAAELGRCELNASELSALEPGQIVILDAPAGELACLCLNGRRVATGEVVVAGGQLALRLIEVETSAVPADDSMPSASGSSPNDRLHA